jgi:hypothetical protein
MKPLMLTALIAIAGTLPTVACGGGSGPAAPMPGPTIPSYAGAWTGTYLVSSCTNSGVFAEAALCSQVLNTTASVAFTLAQNDRTVTGTFRLGALISSQATAMIAGDGSLTIVAPVQDGVFSIATTWTLQQATPGALTGQTQQVWTVSGQTGVATLQGSIVSVTRTSG